MHVIQSHENERCLQHWTRRRPTQKISGGGTVSVYKINKICFPLLQTAWTNRSIYSVYILTNEQSFEVSKSHNR